MTFVHKIMTTPPDVTAFQPYGEILAPPDTHGGRRPFAQWLMPTSGLELHCHLNAVAASALPVALDRMEKHPHAAQIFLPLDVSRYLVSVMPSDAEGRPDPARTLSMVVPGTRGVVYRPGVWHAPITVLDRDGHFAVMMLRGAVDDDVIVAIPPLTLTGLRAQELAP